MTVAAFLSALAAFTLIAWASGPAVLATAHAAMAKGFVAAARLSLGLAVGVTLWGLMVAVGFGAALAASEQALTVLRIVGGLYLLWLALGAARSAASPHPPARAAISGFRAGLLLNLANPKAVFAWMAVLSLVAGASMACLLVLTTACGLSALLGYLLWAVALSRQRVMAAYAAFSRWIDGTLAALFGLAGLTLLRDGITR